MQEPKLLLFFLTNYYVRLLYLREKNQIYSLIEAGLEIWF